MAGAAILLLALCGTPISASDSDHMNRILGEDRATTTVTAPPTQTVPSKPDDDDDRKERWIEGRRAIENFQLIAAQRVPGSSCREIIFQSAPEVRRRYEPRAGDTLTLDSSEVCLIGLRNSSERRAVLVRVDEGFERLAISASPHLFTGQILKPKEQIRIPVRFLKDSALQVRLEVMWDDQREDPRREIDTITVEFKGKRP